MRQPGAASNCVINGFHDAGRTAINCDSSTVVGGIDLGTQAISRLGSLGSRHGTLSLIWPLLAHKAHCRDHAFKLFEELVDLSRITPGSSCNASACGATVTDVPKASVTITMRVGQLPEPMSDHDYIWRFRNPDGSSKTDAGGGPISTSFVSIVSTSLPSLLNVTFFHRIWVLQST